MSAGLVVLWRHGRTGFNREGRFQGQADAPLDHVGRAQAAAAAPVLSSVVSEPVRLVSSDLSRAADTAAPLAALLGVPVEPDPDLREVHAGEWQGLTRDEIAATWPEDWAAWRSDDEGFRVGGGGESRREASARTAAAIAKHDAAASGGTLVVVSHGAVLRGAVPLLTGGGTFDVLGNAHWALLSRRGGAWSLRAYNLCVAV